MADNSLQKKPKLIVFDLDYTLWPFWIDTHIALPLHKDKKGSVLDVHGQKIKYYQDVPKVLKKLHSKGYTLAVASRTTEIDGANQLLELLDWDKFFTYKEIYPGCKVNHFKRFKSLTGLQYSEMLFFDDEERNKIDLKKIGVLTITVRDGVTTKVMERALNEYNL